MTSSRRLRSPIRALPWGLLGAAVLVAGGERFVARRSLDFTASENWEWRDSAHTAGHEARAARVLAFGSSLMKLGVAPRALEPAVGGPVVNLGLCAGSPITSYYLFRRALGAGARPRAVVVEFHTAMVAESPWHTAGFWPDLLDTREALDLALAARDPRLFAAVAIARRSPSVKDRPGLRAAVIAALSGGSIDDDRIGRIAMLRNIHTNLGAKLAFRRAEGATVAPPADPEPWAITLLNDRYVRRFLDLARDRGVAVVWVLMPVRADLQARRAACGIDGAYKRYARGLLSAYPNLTVVDGTTGGYPADVFVDGQHLDRDGALCLSAGLGPIVRSALAENRSADRWLGLPPPARPTYEVAVEDTLESSRAVRRALNR
jgi:hypothetical protein